MTEQPTQERRKVTLILNTETHRQLKVYAANHDTDVSNLIEKIAQDFLLEEREAAYIREQVKKAPIKKGMKTDDR